MAGSRKGIPNRRSQQLLIALRKDHNFEIIDEVLWLYNDSKKIYLAMFAKVQENLDKGRPPTEGMENGEIQALNTHAERMGMTLKQLMAYCYPKRKAIDIGQHSGENIQFNISIPKVEDPIKQLPAPREKTDV